MTTTIADPMIATAMDPTQWAHPAASAYMAAAVVGFGENQSGLLELTMPYAFTLSSSLFGSNAPFGTTFGSEGTTRGARDLKSISGQAWMSQATRR